MRHHIVNALRWILRLILPANGEHRATPTPTELLPVVVVTRRQVAPKRPQPDPWELRPYPYSALVRPYVHWDTWRAELDAMEAARKAEQERQRERLAALWAIANGEPDPGYTFPGAHYLDAVMV
ncbi:hypothetical protein ACWC5I_08780 [Kitasatospora sp. NPDC001574]